MNITDRHRNVAKAIGACFVEHLQQMGVPGADTPTAMAALAEYEKHMAELIAAHVPDHTALLSDVAHQLESEANRSSKAGIYANVKVMRELAQRIFAETARGKDG